MSLFYDSRQSTNYYFQLNFLRFIFKDSILMWSLPSHNY